MGYREQQALREFRDEFEAEERRKQEERDRPLKEAEQRINQTAKELLAVQKENILKLPDDELYIAPELQGAKMTWEQASAFNKSESHKFVEANPDFYPCSENHLQLAGYFERQRSCNIISAPMWEAAYKKLDSLGLMIHRPAPEPVIEQTPEPVEPVQEQPRPYTIGRDLRTGEPREYSQYEIDKMSAGEFRMIFNLRSIYRRQIDPRTGFEAE